MFGGLLAALMAVPAAPAYAAPGDAWPDGVNPDSVRAATVGAASITAGRAHSCAVTSVGAVHCWGSDSDGQLGDGGPLTDVTRAVPVQAGAMQVVVQVDAGEEHTCALEYRGVLYCWGDNSSGQLGVDDSTDRNAPAATAFPSSAVLVEVTAGADHSCAIDEDGAAWCWGDNAHGQLGTGAGTSSDEPARVSDATGLTDPVVDIAAGGNTTCAATAAEVAWCWGAGDRGQTGDGGSVDRVRPARVSTTGPLDDVRVRQIAVGKERACAVDGAGRASCWGAGRSDVPVAAGGPAFSQVAVGGEHICGLDRPGAGWCWGAGGEGQLGDGGTADRAAPGRVGRGDRDLDSALRDMDSGDEHTCALDALYVAFCWGNGGAGRLGAGAVAASRVPVEVLGLPRSPAAVTHVRVVPLDGGLRVSWRPVTDFGSGDFVSYLAVTSDFTAVCDVGTATGTGCDLTGLTNGANYDVAVLTYATEGTSLSEFATAAPGLTPTAPPPSGAPSASPAPAPVVPAPGEGGGELPATLSEPLVPPVAALGFLLIALGLAALMVRKAE